MVAVVRFHTRSNFEYLTYLLDLDSRHPAVADTWAKETSPVTEVNLKRELGSGRGIHVWAHGYQSTWGFWGQRLERGMVLTNLQVSAHIHPAATPSP